MFGNQDQQKKDDNQIPAHAIDEVVGKETGAPAVSPDPTEDTASDSAADSAQTDSSSAATPALNVPSLTTPTPSGDANELIDIKQEALTQLSPLLGHLDQTAEEKFRTTMMMIQASDNHSLVKAAYEAAQQITDEKVRAQALLDIINEINYFTQHNQA